MKVVFLNLVERVGIETYINVNKISNLLMYEVCFWGSVPFFVAISYQVCVDCVSSSIDFYFMGEVVRYILVCSLEFI